MRIAHKLFLGSLFLAAMIWAVGLYAVRVSQRALRESIEQTSVSLARKVMDDLDETIASAVDSWRVYATNPLVQEVVEESNRRFEEMSEIQGYIDREDRQWQESTRGQSSPLMEQLLGNRLSQDLRRRLGTLEKIYGYPVFGEAFVTNRYGAIAALSGRTSDYRQDDEDWWQRAMKQGVYVCDVEYDNSAEIYSVDICIRIDDAEGRGIGVVKAILDIQGIVRILRSAATAASIHSASPRLDMKLYTSHRRVIFPPDGPGGWMHDGSAELAGLDPWGSPVQYLRREDPKLGEILSICALSLGHRDFPGLDWVLVIQHRAAQIYAPIRRLRDAILVIAGLVTALGLGIAMSISISISNRLRRLRNAELEVGRGHFVKAEDASNDEIGQLASCFNRMVHDLRETTVSRSFVENIYKSMVDTLLILSPEGEIKRANDAALSLLGYEESDLIGRRIEEVVAPGEELGEGWMARLMETGAISSVDAEYVTKGGRRVPVSFSASVMRDEDGALQGIVCVAVDITKRKQAEQELARSNQELEQFAYVASHDLQEPLRMVSSFVELLAQEYEGKLDQDADDYIHFAVDGARRMQALITDLLTFSRVRTRGKEPEPTDAGKVLDSVLSDLREAIREADAEIRREPLPTVMADPTQLAQLFQNLLSNAIKYRGRRRPEVTVSAEVNGSMCRFAVRDNGIGIEPQYLEQIFVIFQRLHKREDYPGTGIGLAVCKRIVERHGGRIWAESTPGEGSTFYFTLPTA